MSATTRKHDALRSLPLQPSLEHLRNEAKQRRKLIQQTSPSTKLSEAQFVVAREYGFSSWRELKAEVEKQARTDARLDDTSRLDRYVGFYLVVTDHAANVTLTITLEGLALFVRVTGGPKFELAEEGQNVFTLASASLRYAFQTNEEGRVSGVVVTNPYGDHRMPRVDAARAAEVEKVFAAALNEQTQPRTEIEVAPDVLKRVAGFYSKPLGPPIEIVLKEGGLFAQLPGQRPDQLYPESTTKFFSRKVAAQFSFEIETSESRALVLHQNGREFWFPRTTEAVAKAAAEPISRKAEEQERPRVAIQLGAAVLQRYVGEYELASGKAVTVTAESGQLFIQLAGQKRYEVHAESECQFFWTVVPAQITFNFDKAGEVAGAVLHQSGRDIPIARLEGGSPEAEAA